VTIDHDASPITVLLADDQAMVRTGFRMIIDSQPDMTVIGEADNGRSAVDLAQRIRPDVSILDIQMPLLDGLAATSRSHCATEQLGSFSRTAVRRSSSKPCGPAPSATP
jgi:DNA-binding NarL/FixJ family response regulator